MRSYRPMTAGQLTKRVTLLEPVEGLDEDRQPVLSYEDRGTVRCNVRWLRGGESVMAARLQSRSPAIITVRASSLTRQVTSEWRAVIDGRTFEAKEHPRETDNRAFLEFLVEGTANG